VLILISLKILNLNKKILPFDKKKFCAMVIPK